MGRQVLDFLSMMPLAVPGLVLAFGYLATGLSAGKASPDETEDLAIARAKELFGCDHVNVQPHSGASANAAVIMALANPGDSILGLSLAHGGHLTHGMKLNFSGKMYEAHAYGLNPETFLIDMDIVRQTSASFLSNVFRYKMIQKTDAVWIDCDAFCHKPFPDEMDAIFAGHGMRGALNCGVVYIPQKGALMDQLLDYYDNLPAAPAWFNKQQRKKLEKQDRSLPQAVRIYNAERTAFGPQAFTWFAQQTGDFEKALTPDYLYPVPFQLNDVFYDPYGRVEGHFTDNTLSVHLYTNGTKPWWRRNPPMPNSYAARMCELEGLDPAGALEE